MKINFELIENTSVPKAIAKMATPTILSQLVTLLYNLADTFFVGHTNDPVQIAALTLSFPLFMSITMLGNLFGIGANSLISRSLGSGNRKTPPEASVFAIWGALTLTAVWIVILSANKDAILRFIGAKASGICDATWTYLMWTVVFGGLPSVTSLIIAHCIRGEGNTVQASTGVALGGILNIVLDPVFVQFLHLGAEGAGIATFLSNIASLVYLLLVVKRSRNTVVVLNPAKLTFNPYVLREVLLVGLPSASVVVLGATANIVLTHCMSAYGEVSLAAFGVVQKAGTVTMQITVGMTQGIMPLLGYYFGAKKHEKVNEISRCAFGLLGVFSLVSVLTAELCPRFIITLFTGEKEIVALGAQFLQMWILCSFGMCFVNLIGSIFQATGKWEKALALSITRQAALFIPVMLVLNRIWGLQGLIISQPVADTIALALGFAMYCMDANTRSNSTTMNQQSSRF